MIRALVSDGKLCPIDPLPEEWTEGKTVEIEGSVNQLDESTEWDHWLEDMDVLTAELNDPAEWARLEQAFVRQDRIAKAAMNRN